VAIDPVNGNAYVAQQGAGAVGTYARNSQTGLLAAAVQTIMPTLPIGITVLGFASSKGR